MIRFFYGDQLETCPRLRQSMFLDRADQFSKRLGWDVTVNTEGFETDEYDALNPLYVIARTPTGKHAGSLRFLPTTGRVMVNEHFLDLTNGVEIKSPLIWECSRFCLADRQQSAMGTSARLLLAAGMLGQKSGIAHAVGVFDERMIRIYQRLGWSPTIVGSGGTGADRISVGLWDFAKLPYDTLCKNAGLERHAPKDWFKAPAFA